MYDLLLLPLTPFGKSALKKCLQARINHIFYCIFFQKKDRAEIEENRLSITDEYEGGY